LHIDFAWNLALIFAMLTDELAFAIWSLTDLGMMKTPQHDSRTKHDLLFV